MDSKLKHIPYRKLFQALLITIALAAFVHLIMVTIAAVVQHSISYINPLDFLGFSIVFPQHRESREIAAIGWLVLIATFVAVFYTSVHYKLYLSLLRDSRVGVKLGKITKQVGIKASGQKTVTEHVRAKAAGKSDK